MTNAIVPANADINATLRALGLMEPEGTSDFNRAKINGASFELGDEIFPSNQKTKTPAFIGRILEMPDEYQAYFFNEDDAAAIGRPDIAGRFCKSHHNPVKYPNEADPNGGRGKYAEDGTECARCPINPYIKGNLSPLGEGRKCKWRGDVLFQLCEPDGTTLDPRPWTLSLSTTGMIELKGMRKEPEKGYASDLNFMQRLARLGLETFPDDPDAIKKAAVALAMGGVIAEFRLISVKADGARNFEVASLNPIAIVEPTGPAAGAALPAGTKNVTPAYDEEDLPF